MSRSDWMEHYIHHAQRAEARGEFDEASACWRNAANLCTNINAKLRLEDYSALCGEIAAGKRPPKIHAGG